MGPLPEGTVTFLFTDIEGNTRLWEEFPEAMKVALTRLWRYSGRAAEGVPCVRLPTLILILILI
jgi:class 3 adenylate cyclase